MSHHTPPIPTTTPRAVRVAPVPANPFGAAKRVALPNPFAPSTAVARAAEPELDLSGVDPERLVYGIAASGPPVDANEVESAQQALEVMVMWGRSVLHVDHLSPARSFYVGEAQGKDEPVDFLLTPEVLGATRLPITLVAEGGTFMVFPEGATGELVRDGERTVIESIMLEPCLAHAGAKQFAIPAGATVSMSHRGFTFVAKSVRAGKKVAGGFAWDWSPLAYAGSVLAMVGLLLGVMYFTPPAVAGLNNDLVDPNSRLAQFVISPVETDAPQPDDTTPSSSEGGEASASAPGEQGEMGDENAPRTTNRAAVRGDANPEDERVAHDALTETAAHAGPIGTVLASMQFNGPTSPYGADQALGSSEISALGALTGPQAGQNFGLGGLGLTGTGRGGNYGVLAGQLGSGPIGTHGACRGARCGGYDDGTDGSLGPREPRRPQISAPAPSVTGSLAADAIRRVVRRHLAEVRYCYEGALTSQPDLSGTVSVRFVINPSGAVAASTIARSTLGSARVESCVANAVRRWSFPQPDNGMVAVTYPFTLSTGE
ncbi:MAG: TonB family protein [Myxococcales bacterium]|nr:TonB family protein [Myxococcales bacterium]